jgi:hypothetical protein
LVEDPGDAARITASDRLRRDEKKAGAPVLEL